MKLYIAEKPSLGRAIAAALPGPRQQGQGWICCGSGAEALTVSWCIGHLLEPAEPARYNPRWQKWRAEDLPLFPETWELMPKESVKQQLKVLESLIRQAELIFHAGDPDREGQLLVDEVIRYFGATCPVQRILINDLTPAAVARALAQPRDNREFRRLSHSALARQRADWLYGINLTRHFTLSYQRQGEQGVYSVGRVQTPVLGLVVERDNTIAHFEPKPFFRILAHCHGAEDTTAQPQTFAARWLPSEAWREHLDEEDRLLSGDTARQIADSVEGRPGRITESRFRDRNEPPPLPLSLSALQIEAGKLFRMAAKEVLDTAQNLYERHQLITYPRSDCRYLPEEHFGQRDKVVNAIGRISGELEPHCAAADLSRRSSAWNDSKVDAHHAIIPTARTAPSGKLSEQEANIYQLVSRYYLMQFSSDAIHREGKLTLTIGEHLFRATETAVLEPGWKALEIRQRDSRREPEKAPLPRLKKGDAILCRQAEIQERKTQPPQHFTDATLLAAMTNIARFVSDPELRKTLRETDGLGTEATRAAIIETLFRREYLTREKRHIKATDKGKALISALPDAIRRPDTTAVWEASLDSIRQGSADPRAFMSGLKEQILGFLNTPPDSAGSDAVPADSNQPHCPACRAPMVEREGKFGRFFACRRFPACKGTRPIEDDTPQDGTSQKPIPCPHCFAPLVRRKGRTGWFWGCSNFPGCRQTIDDDNGKPRSL